MNVLPPAIGPNSYVALNKSLISAAWAPHPWNGQCGEGLTITGASRRAGLGGLGRGHWGCHQRAPRPQES